MQLETLIIDFVDKIALDYLVRNAPPCTASAKDKPEPCDFIYSGRNAEKNRQYSCPKCKQYKSIKLKINF